MMESILGLLVYAFSQTIVGIIWGIRQEGRIDALEQGIISQRELLESKLDDIKNRLVRIEAHVLNGHGEE